MCWLRLTKSPLYTMHITQQKQLTLIFLQNIKIDSFISLYSRSFHFTLLNKGGMINVGDTVWYHTKHPKSIGLNGNVSHYYFLYLIVILLCMSCKDVKNKSSHLQTLNLLLSLSSHGTTESYILWVLIIVSKKRIYCKLNYSLTEYSTAIIHYQCLISFFDSKSHYNHL